MRINLKSEKGAITFVVLVGMLFLTAFLMCMYIGIANRAQNSAETTKQIQEQYNNLNEANAIYDSYFADSDIIPITTVEQLKKIASGEQVTINGKIYTFSPSAYYTIQNDLDLGGVYDEDTKVWSGEQWTPLTSEFTGTLDGLGHTISGIYINNSESKQGLFGTLNGTVKNLNIEESYIKGNIKIGSIAGSNNGTIQNCHNEAIILGNSDLGGMAGQNNGTINVKYVENLLCYHEEFINSSNVLDINTKYLDNNKKTVVIPKGFNILELEATDVEEGIVIQDVDENEFVWIPVENAIVTQEEIAKIKAKGSATTDLSAVQSLVNNGITPIAVQIDKNNYKGILYNFGGTDVLKKVVLDWNSLDGQREPSILEDVRTWSTATTVNGKKIEAGTEYVYDSKEMFELYDVGEFTDTLYQDSFNNMAKSVENYGGFYVGRYEMSLYEDISDVSIKYAQSKENKNQLGSKTWYELYKYGRDYTTYNTNLGVFSEMIWGSQWDQVMIFVNGKNDSSASAFYVNVYGSRNSEATVETKTGMNPKDKVANIFDLEGSRYEWTQEARNGFRRVLRAGHYSSGFGSGKRVTMNATFNPTNAINTLSSRLSLYINGGFDKK